MANVPSPNDMRNLWQDQEVEPVKMSLQEIRKRAQAYQRRIRRRNTREYAAVAFIVIFFGFTIWKLHDPLKSVGPGLLMTGALYMAYQLHRRASARPVPADVTCIDFYRRELSRQVLFHRKIWSWYLGPMIPGIAAIILSASLDNSSHWRYARLFLALYVVFCVLAFLFVAKLNQDAARKLQHRIDELDAAEKQS